MAYADEKLESSFAKAIDSFKRPQLQAPFDGSKGVFIPQRYTDVVSMAQFIRFMEKDGADDSFIDELAKYGKLFKYEIVDDYFSRTEYANMLKAKKKDESPAKKQEKLAKLVDAKKNRSEEFGIGKVAQQENLVSFLFY